MQDRVPVNPGRVLITPENGPSYYATMTRADNPTQNGTPLNKASLLKDATAALFGLGADAVPDDVFGVLSRFQSGLGNEYVWAKTTVEWEVPVGSAYNLTLYHPTYASYNTVYYSDKYTYDENSKTVTLENYKTLTINISQTDTTYLQVLRGQYVIGNPAASQNYAVSSVNGTPGMYRIDDDATFTISNSQLTCGAKIMRAANIQANATVYGYVNSPDSNAYPPAVSDGYTYAALGQLGNKVRIATGSYAGTGTYGASHPNSLTFDFVPKLVFVCGGAPSYSTGEFIMIRPDVVTSAKRTYGNLYSGSINKNTYIYSYGNTVYWYDTGSEHNQYNASNGTYYYVGIG